MFSFDGAYIEIEYYSAKEASEILCIGKNTLLKKLRNVGVLKSDNSVSSEFKDKQMFKSFKKPIYGRKYQVNTCYVVSISDKGLDYIRKEVLND